MLDSFEFSHQEPSLPCMAPVRKKLDNFMTLFFFKKKIIYLYRGARSQSAFYDASLCKA